MNGDGQLDIITGNYDGNSISILLAQASGSFAPAENVAVALGQGINSVALGDVNGDGRPDLVTANFLRNTVGVMLNTFTALATARPAAASLTLSPNPAHDAFTVQLPASLLPTSAELLNALGQVVRRPAVGAGSFKVETSGLAPGVYTLHLLAGGAALARRVVVE